MYTSTQNVKILNARLRNIRLTRAKALLKRFGWDGFKKILFSDEKIFTVEEHINKQNNRYHAKNYHEVRKNAPPVEHAHHTEHIMAWWGVSYGGVTSIHFCDPGIKTDGPVYQKMPNSVVKPVSHSSFCGTSWIFQQDSVPSHLAKDTQKWCQENLPSFICADD